MRIYCSRIYVPSMFCCSGSVGCIGMPAAIGLRVIANPTVLFCCPALGI